MKGLTSPKLHSNLSFSINEPTNFILRIYFGIIHHIFNYNKQYKTNHFVLVKGVVLECRVGNLAQW